MLQTRSGLWAFAHAIPLPAAPFLVLLNLPSQLTLPVSVSCDFAQEPRVFPALPLGYHHAVCFPHHTSDAHSSPTRQRQDLFPSPLKTALPTPHTGSHTFHTICPLSLQQLTFLPRRNVLYQLPGFSLDQEASFTWEKEGRLVAGAHRVLSAFTSHP